MLTQETKRHIDAARQILVGVVPNPSSQIDQITNALIYKFMDDMDQFAIKAGGEPSFFVGNLERYAWTRLMDSRLGNQERMNLYSEALVKFSEAKQLPELFRGIFKSAFLPYRSPEVLGLFLKEINYFDYSHSEELGNAYEYLLSIMGSQGDAGQFRTPRHIIDFIVAAVNPTKDDKVLDPACGTAGFLVSAYKHILEQHDGKDSDDSKNSEKPLTPDQRRALMNNFEGYDVDPGMVRISQVNMYLHHFRNPKIYNYNTLSQDERWADKFDVILANPPFMSPKGGVSTHNKFGIPSNRSEVLFVDYFITHLRPKGRAGMIVPEGIIFQSAIAHKALRKKLVEDGLYAVVSLPSGVFQPYSGVKTSILFFDNERAKQNAEILFIKVENDGFDLGAQRRKIDKDDLPQALKILKKWKHGGKVESKLAVYVERDVISGSDDYNLSGDRYRVAVDYTNAKWPIVELGEVCEISTGNSAPQDPKFFKNGKYPFFRTSDVGAVHQSDDLKQVNDWLNEEGTKGLKLFPKGTILFPKSGASTFLNHRVIMGMDGYVSSHLATIFPKKDKALSKFVYYLLLNVDAKQLTVDQAYPSLKTSEIAKVKIPLLPLEVQGQIVAELDAYQNIVYGARKVAQNWKPKIDIDPEWEKVKLGEVCEVKSGGTPSRDKSEYWNGDIPWYSSGELNNLYTEIPKEMITKKGLESSNASIFKKGSLLIGIYDTAAFKMSMLDRDATFNQAICGIKPNTKVDLYFLYLYFNKKKADYLTKRVGVRQRNLSKSFIYNLEISLPSLNIQKQIVEKIRAERTLVESAKKLVGIYEQKTKEVIAKLWSE